MSDWRAHWDAGEPFGCSSDITGRPSYGYGALDNHGFFALPVPAAFADAHAAENKARWDARREEEDAYALLANAFSGYLLI